MSSSFKVHLRLLALFWLGPLSPLRQAVKRLLHQWSHCWTGTCSQNACCFPIFGPVCYHLAILGVVAGVGFREVATSAWAVLSDQPQPVVEVTRRHMAVSAISGPVRAGPVRQVTAAALASIMQRTPCQTPLAVLGCLRQLVGAAGACYMLGNSSALGIARGLAAAVPSGVFPWQASSFEMYSYAMLAEQTHLQAVNVTAPILNTPSELGC